MMIIWTVVNIMQKFCCLVTFLMTSRIQKIPPQIYYNFSRTDYGRNVINMSSFFSGLQLNGRFGTGLAVVDINADGLSDLAVGAPSVGAADFQFHVGMLLRTF